MHRAGVLVLSATALFLAMALRPSVVVRADTLTVYKCRTQQGGLTYQGTPCPRNQQQQTMRLDDSGPGSPPPPQPVKPASPVASLPNASLPPPAPSTPPSVMYRCVRATDQTTYLSNNGDPQPYYAPLAMTGMLPAPLGHITPGVKPNAAMIASQYVLVQDQCIAMTPQETCSTLRDQYDETERKLSRAFKSDQPPLLQREQALLSELSHC